MHETCPLLLLRIVFHDEESDASRSSSLFPLIVYSIVAKQKRKRENRMLNNMETLSSTRPHQPRPADERPAAAHVYLFISVVVLDGV